MLRAVKGLRGLATYLTRNALENGSLTDGARMANTDTSYSSLDAFRAVARPIMWTIFVFSMAVNARMLTAPLYMLQVYDRVLASRSEETLVALIGLVAVVFGLTVVKVSTEEFTEPLFGEASE